MEAFLLVIIPYFREEINFNAKYIVVQKA